MLDDHAGALPEGADALDRRVGIGQVVEAQRLALHLVRGGDAGVFGRRQPIVRGPLMGVLAITQFTGLAPRQQQGLGERVRGMAAQVVADQDVVAGRVGERLRGQFPPEALRRAAVAEGRKHPRVVAGIANHREPGMVLGRRAQHGRPAHVDLLDGAFLGGVRVEDCGFERVEIDGQEVDPADAVFFDGGLVHAAARQQPAVHGRMKRLDAAVHDFRKTGELGNLQHLKARRAQCAGRAPRGNQFEPEVGQPPAKIRHAGLVGNADKGAAGPRRAAAHSSSRS